MNVIATLEFQLEIEVEIPDGLEEQEARRQAIHQVDIHDDVLVINRLDSVRLHTAHYRKHVELNWFTSDDS